MTTPQPPSGLRAWGKRLWDDVTGSDQFDSAGYFLLAEACRTADIVEQLSGALRSGSNEWIRLADEAEEMADGSTLKIHIVVNPILGEIRQQRLALRQLLAQLKLGKTEASDGDGDDDEFNRLMASFNTPD